MACDKCLADPCDCGKPIWGRRFRSEGGLAYWLRGGTNGRPLYGYRRADMERATAEEGSRFEYGPIQRITEPPYEFPKEGSKASDPFIDRACNNAVLMWNGMAMPTGPVTGEKITNPKHVGVRAIFRALVLTDEAMKLELDKRCERPEWQEKTIDAMGGFGDKAGKGPTMPEVRDRAEKIWTLLGGVKAESSGPAGSSGSP